MREDTEKKDIVMSFFVILEISNQLWYTDSSGFPIRSLIKDSDKNDGSSYTS